MCPPLDVLPSEPPGRSTSWGRCAEDLAASYLRLRGFRILARNYRDGPRELDLVCAWSGALVVVEVRCRARVDRGRPEETVPAWKKRHLLRAGRRFWLDRGRDVGRLRFDLIAIELTASGLSLRHFPEFMNPG
jgi:putative endonuclease